MKKSSRTGIFGIIALVAVSAFTLCACGDSDNRGAGPVGLLLNTPQIFNVGATANGVSFILADPANPVSVQNKTVTLQWDGPGAFTTPPITAITDASGQFTLDLTGEIIGSVTLTVTLPAPDNREASCILSVGALGLLMNTPQVFNERATANSVGFTLADPADPAAVQNKTVTLEWSGAGAFTTPPLTTVTDASGQFSVDLTGATHGSVTLTVTLPAPDNRSASCILTVGALGLFMNTPQTFNVGTTANGVAFTLADPADPASVQSKTVLLAWSGAGAFTTSPLTAATDGSGQFTLDLTGATVGSVTLTVTLPSPDNRTASCTLTVGNLGLNMNTTQIFNVGATANDVDFTLADPADPASVQNKTVTLEWSGAGAFSTAPLTAATNGSGQFALDLTGATAGSVTLTVTLPAPDNRSASCTLTVEPPTGSGAFGDPWLIYNAAQLKSLADQVNAGDDKSGKYYKLADNIDLSAYGAGYASGAGWTPIGSNSTYRFRGHFDGDGKTVSNLFINRSGGEYIGLFGYIDGGEVKNLGVRIADPGGGAAGVTGFFYVGGVAGYVLNSSITNCYVTGNVIGNEFVGGVVGCVYTNSSVSNCYTTGNVEGNIDIGGVAGWVGDNSNVSNCYATGDVTGIGTTYGFWIGGVAGRLNDSTLSNCYATGTVSGIRVVGGVVGASDNSTVSNCAALNPAIVRTSGSYMIFGRVAGTIPSSTHTNNVGLSGMALPDGVLTGDPGDDITILQATTNTPPATNFYSAPITPGPGLGWLFGVSNTNPWQWGAVLAGTLGIPSTYNLPVLYWQKEIPATLPAHLQ